jgi:hypothetical protein
LRVRQEAEALSMAMLGCAEALGRWWLTTEAMAPQEAAELLISVLGPGLAAYARMRAGAGQHRGGQAAA